MKVITYTLGTQFATYVEYGDIETLSNVERQEFDDLEQAARDNAPEGHYFAPGLSRTKTMTNSPAAKPLA